MRFKTPAFAAKSLLAPALLLPLAACGEAAWGKFHFAAYSLFDEMFFLV